MAIITYPLNGILYDAADAETYLCTRESGVYATDQFVATITGAREITVGTGIAWIKNATYKGKSVVSNEATVLTFTLADGSLPRIDRIVLKFDRANSVSTIEVVNGTPATNPTAPAITRNADFYELGLYEITRPAGSVSITASDIHSTMLDESVCGLMRDGVTGIATQALYNEFFGWFEETREILDSDVAGNLLNRINKSNEVRPVTLTAAEWSVSGSEYMQTQTPDGTQLSPSDNPLLVSLLANFPSYTTAQRKSYTKTFGRIAMGSATINSDGSVTFKTPKQPKTTITVGLKGI